MRTSIRTGLLVIFGLAVASNLIGFGFVTGASAQTAAPTAAPTTAATEAATMSATVYPPCTAVPSPQTTIVPASATPTTAGPTVTSASYPPNSKAYLGIVAYSVQMCGIRVMSLQYASPAANSDLQLNDIIVAVDNTSMNTIAMNSQPVLSASAPTPVAPYFSPVAFYNYLEATYTPGQTVVLTVQRAGMQLEIPVTLGAVRPVVATATASR